MGWRLSPRVACPSTKFCMAGTDSRVDALSVPHDCGKRQEQLMEMPNVASQDRIQQRTFVQFADFPVVMEELFLKAFSQGKVQQRLVDQMIEVPKSSSKDHNLQSTGEAGSRCYRAAARREMRCRDCRRTNSHRVCWPSSATRDCGVQGHDRIRTDRF